MLQHWRTLPKIEGSGSVIQCTDPRIRICKKKSGIRGTAKEQLVTSWKKRIWITEQCCGAGAEIKKSKPKLRIAASALTPFYLLQTWRNFKEKKTWLLNKFFLIVTILILLLKSKRVICMILQNYMEPGLEPKFGFAAPRSRSRKIYFGSATLSPSLLTLGRRNGSLAERLESAAACCLISSNQSKWRCISKKKITFRA